MSVRLTEGATSKVAIGPKAVVKTVTLGVPGLVSREAAALRRLGGVGWAPRLISEAGNILIMTNVGVPVEEAGLPKDAEGQGVVILRDMAERGVSHNDIRPENLLVSEDGRLMLIDFGWATLDGAELEDPPGNLGGSERSPEGLDDAYSMRLSLKRVRAAG